MRIKVMQGLYARTANPGETIADGLKKLGKAIQSCSDLSYYFFSLLPEALTLPNPSATYQISFLSFCDIQSMGNIDPTAMMDPNAATNFASNIYLDDIRIGYAIVCNNPTDLSVSNVTTTSATVTWGGTADNWSVEYGPAGFTTGNGTTVTAQNPTYTFTGLTPGTSYDVHVRANCPRSV